MKGENRRKCQWPFIDSGLPDAPSRSRRRRLDGCAPLRSASPSANPAMRCNIENEFDITIAWSCSQPGTGESCARKDKVGRRCPGEPPFEHGEDAPVSGWTLASGSCPCDAELQLIYII